MIANASSCQSAKINGPLEPLDWNWGTDEIMGLHPLVFRREGTKLWGAFDFEDCMGILLVDPAPVEASYDTLLCNWRGRENGEGQMMWDGPDCTGELVFLGGG